MERLPCFNRCPISIHCVDGSALELVPVGVSPAPRIFDPDGSRVNNG